MQAIDTEIRCMRIKNYNLNDIHYICFISIVMYSFPSTASEHRIEARIWMWIKEIKNRCWKELLLFASLSHRFLHLISLLFDCISQMIYTTQPILTIYYTILLISISVTRAQLAEYELYDIITLAQPINVNKKKETQITGPSILKKKKKNNCDDTAMMTRLPMWRDPMQITKLKCNEIKRNKIE